MKKSVNEELYPTTVFQLKEALSDEGASFVLITCSSPDSNGKMHVNMDTNGDPDLIDYLLKNAVTHLD